MANIDYYFDQWQKDSHIDRTELGEESIKIPQLHHKYYKFYSNERLQMLKLNEDIKRLKKNKFVWYMGNMSREELDDLEWEQNPLKILKQDVPMYVDGDEEVIEMNLKIGYQKEKVDFLENAIRSLTNRGFNIKSAIDWEKFKVGI